MEKFYPIVVVQISAADGGGFMGYVPDLKGCMSHGDTPEEAMANAREAALEWIEEARHEGWTIPEPGSAAGHARKERDRLLETVKSQSQAIEKMNADIQKFEADIETLSRTLDAVSARLHTENPYAGFIAHDQMNGFEEPIH